MEDVVDEGWDDDEEPTESTEGSDLGPQVADQAIDLVRPDLVDRVVKILLADADRGEGLLKRSDINRAYLRKRLSIAECIEVEHRLVASSCTVVEDDEGVRLDRGARGFEHGLKARDVTHGEVGEDLAVDADARGLEERDQARVVRPERARGGADAGDPQAAKVTLAELAADVRVRPGLVHGLDRGAVEARTPVAEALGVGEDALTVLCRDKSLWWFRRFRA